MAGSSNRASELVSVVNALDNLQLDGVSCGTEFDQYLQEQNDGAFNSDPVSGGSCPICLQEMDLRDMTTIPGCDHTYCVYCIVRWSAFKDPPNCPQCKRKFTSVFCFRELDGTLRDEMREESLCLLKRAEWFQTGLKELNKQSNRRKEASRHQGLIDEDYEFEEYYTNDIDDVEDYYFSSAAGNARVVLGNRRFGKNGYIRTGRVYAQSTGAQRPSKKKGKKGPKKQTDSSGSMDAGGGSEGRSTNSFAEGNHC